MTRLVLAGGGAVVALVALTTAYDLGRQSAWLPPQVVIRPIRLGNEPPAPPAAETPKVAVSCISDTAALDATYRAHLLREGLTARTSHEAK